MNWATKYAISNLSETKDISVEIVSDDFLKLSKNNKPDVFAYICDTFEIDTHKAEAVAQAHPQLDFICGYRKECLWHGRVILLLKEKRIGWGSFGTLTSALDDGNANTADHKTYRYAARMLEQMGGVSLEREFDRVFNITRSDGEQIRLVMSDEYEPSSDIVRKLWSDFGPFDIIHNINPNVRPTGGGYEAANALGTQVLNHSETMRFIRKK